MVEISNHWGPEKQYQDDSMIMQQLFAKKGLSFQNVSFNACRMYLQVTIVADIAIAGGRILRQEILDCTRIPGRITKWQWPSQPNCNKKNGQWQ